MLKQVTYFTWVHKERWEYLVSWSHTENVLLIHFGAQKRKMNWCLLSHTWVEYVLGLKCCLSLQKSSHSFNFILRMNKNETLWNLNSVYPFRTRFYTHFVSPCCGDFLLVCMEAASERTLLLIIIKWIYQPFFPFSCIMDVKPAQWWCVSWF